MPAAFGWRWPTRTGAGATAGSRRRSSCSGIYAVLWMFFTTERLVGEAAGSAYRLLPSIAFNLSPALVTASALGVIYLVSLPDAGARRLGLMTLLGALVPLADPAGRRLPACASGVGAVPVRGLPARAGRRGSPGPCISATAQDQRRTALVLLLILAAALAPSTASQLIDGSRFDYRPALARIEAEDPEGTVVLWPKIQATWMAPQLKGLEFLSTTPVAMLDSLQAARPRFWVITSERRSGIVGDEDGTKTQWLARHCQRVVTTGGHRLDFEEYRSRPVEVPVRESGRGVQMSSLSTPASRATSFRRLGRQTAIYGLAVVLGRAVSFLMLPVYTRYLSPSDYGIISLLDLTVDVAAIFFTAGATSGVQRFYFKTSDPAGRARLVSTAYFLVLRPQFPRRARAQRAVASDLEVWPSRRRSLLVHHHCGLQFCGRVRCSRCRSISRRPRSGPSSVLASRSTKLVTQLSLNILFIVVLHLGVAGLLLSTLVTCFVLGVGLATWLLRQTGFHFDRAGGAGPATLRRALPAHLGRQLPADVRGSLLPAGGTRRSRGRACMAWPTSSASCCPSSAPRPSSMPGTRTGTSSCRCRPLTATAAMTKDSSYFNLLLITVAVGIAALIRPVLSVMTTPEFHPAEGLVPDHPAGVHRRGLGRDVPLCVRRDRAHPLFDLCHMDRGRRRADPVHGC